MNQYIGTKVINAEPMDRLAYNVFRGWKLPDDENGTDEGYLVEYLDGGEPNTKEYKGYVSWSPKAQFENAYKQNLVEMSFGDAVVYAKMGFKVARKGWNGKGMWISITEGRILNLAKDDIWTENVKSIAIENGGIVETLPYFSMKTADGKLQIGWLASQSDMLANDWMVLPCK